MTHDESGFPFDQLQRYSTVRDLITDIKAVRGLGRLKVLDVGGFFRLSSGAIRFPVRSMLPSEDTLVVDVAQCDERGYVCASGASLPFKDGAFDVVVSCDTLEHVPPANRTQFVGELARVTNRYLILAAPVENENTVLAERIVSEFIRLRLGGTQLQLAEHAANGLPRAVEVAAAIAEVGLYSISFPCEDLQGWLFMMLAKHYLLGIPDSDTLHELVDRYYCGAFPQAPLPESQAAGCYRRFFVASKQADDPFLRFTSEKVDKINVLDASSPTGSSEAGKILDWSLSQILISLTRPEIVPGDAKSDGLRSCGAIAPSPEANLAAKSWFVLRHSGLVGFARECRNYVRWRLARN